MQESLGNLIDLQVVRIQNSGCKGYPPALFTTIRQFLLLAEVYHTRSQTWNLDRAKALGVGDRKSVHISNIDRLGSRRTAGACLAALGRFLNHVRYNSP